MTRDPFRDEIATLPGQFLASPIVAGEALPPGDTLLAGLGGSGFAAEFAALRLPGVRYPVLRDAVLPDSVGPGNRVICVSCSGNTGEMLEVFDAARERGASVGVVTRGGELLKRAENADTLRVVVPGNQSPRASLGHLLRGVFTALGGETPEWEEIAGSVARATESWGELADSPAGRLAAGLRNRLPVLLGMGVEGNVLTRRWAADLAENAKMPSLVWGLPEASHNAIMALSELAQPPAELALVALGQPRLAAHRVRWETLLELLQEKGIEIHRVEGPEGDSWIGTLGLAAMGSWTSLLLAELQGIPAGDLSLMNTYKRKLSDLL
jgi:glucose/mannose-6-phosphate isomerase